MIYRPCSRCTFNYSCGRLADIKKQVRGLGLTLINVKCEEYAAPYPPGKRVQAKQYPVQHLPFMATDAQKNAMIPGTVMKILPKGRFRIWLDELDIRVCEICGRPDKDFDMNPKWVCQTDDGICP